MVPYFFFTCFVVLGFFVSCQAPHKIETFNFSIKKSVDGFFFFSFHFQHCVTRSHTVGRSKWENTQSRWTSSKALSLRGLPFLCQLVFTPKPLPGKTTFLQPVMWKNCLPKVHTTQKKDRCVSFVSVIFRPSPKVYMMKLRLEHLKAHFYIIRARIQVLPDSGTCALLPATTLKEGWAPKSWCFQTVVLEKTRESLLDRKEIQPVNP